MSKQPIELHPIDKRSLRKRIAFRYPDIQGAEYVDAYTNTSREPVLALIARYHGGYTENPVSLILQEGALKRFELQVALFLIANPETYIEILLGSATVKTATRRPLTEDRIIDDLAILAATISNELQEHQHGKKELWSIFARHTLTKAQLQQLALQRQRKKFKFDNAGRF